MSDYLHVGELRVSTVLHAFIENEALPGTGLDPAKFWADAQTLVGDLAPLNHQLLAQRDQLQAAIDSWHLQHRDLPHNTLAYETFLRDIGYLLPEPEDFQIDTQQVDAEIALMAGPQLVVPLSNARFALNAANARWGSLYDALYGSDAISENGGAERTVPYNPVRGAKVIAFAQAFLDQTFPLAQGSHGQVQGYAVDDGQLLAVLADGSREGLRDPAQLVGLRGDALLLKHHGLHVELQLKDATIRDVIMEAALTTIMDCEDSVAAVDADDKVGVYRTWLGLMKGNLSEPVNKGDRQFVRSLNPDRLYQRPQGGELRLQGRALLFVRNVGLLMSSEAILGPDGQPVPENILDALVTGLAAVHDVRGPNAGRNSRTGSVYIVKPKLHGPEEVAFSVALFARVEQLLGLAPDTLKIGIMDEERRTTVNLKACIAAARHRVVFINTGFLDRTGDEIHTSMYGDVMVPKAAMKSQRWLAAYEDWNVDIGLAAGLSGRAQIGKGMWAMPDLMAGMLAQKSAHPMAGASTAWVPSPTAATLHALHYHQVDVFARQRELAQRAPASLQTLLEIPFAPNIGWSESEIQSELDSNAQSILGYVVRWVDQGIGCSKVPDINDIGLMEDRATLRISSQLLSNWLLHNVIDRARIEAAFTRMAAIVDSQNAHDPHYRAMTAELPHNFAYQAALEIVLQGHLQPNGYTEPVLHRWRRQAKSRRH